MEALVKRRKIIKRRSPIPKFTPKDRKKYTVQERMPQFVHREWEAKSKGESTLYGGYFIRCCYRDCDRRAASGDGTLFIPHPTCTIHWYLENKDKFGEVKQERKLERRRHKREVKEEQKQRRKERVQRIIKRHSQRIHSKGRKETMARFTVKEAVKKENGNGNKGNHDEKEGKRRKKQKETKEQRNDRKPSRIGRPTGERTISVSDLIRKATSKKISEKEFKNTIQKFYKEEQGRSDKWIDKRIKRLWWRVRSGGID